MAAGNMFIFLVAGHETSAFTIAFTLTLLAIYPEHQQLIYQEASSAFGQRQGEYSDYNRLVSGCAAARLLALPFLTHGLWTPTALYVSDDSRSA